MTGWDSKINEKKRLTELLSQNRLIEASALCSELRNLRPQDAELWIMQGYIHSQLGDGGAARECLNRAISEQDYNGAAYYYLGLLDEREGKLDAALANYHKSIALSPNDPTGRAYLQLSGLSERQGKLGEMHYFQGCALDARNLLNEAELQFQRALDINPCYVDAHIGIGNTLRKRNMFDEAIAAYQEAIACDPSQPRAHRELGIALGGNWQFDAALVCFDRAISLAPNDAESHYWRAVALLIMGRLAEGWDEYEWRARWSGIARLMGNWRDFKLPLWQGEDTSDKTILVYGEQGVGDEIMFASCFKDLIPSVGHLVIECDHRLSAILKRSFPEATVAGRFRDGDAHWLAQLPPVDFRLPAGSLPRIFRRSLDSFSGQGGYLVADKASVEQWRTRYESLGPGLKVGISWIGGKTPQEKLSRSAPLEQWAALFAMPDLQFINLQYGNHAEVLAQTKSNWGVVIHDWRDSNPLADLDDFAAKIAALDLVISIDNSTVHVAGALGAPTWSLLPHVPEWRWMLGRADSPWYPSMKLFRQRDRGRWTDVFEQVALQLRNLLEKGRDHP